MSMFGNLGTEGLQEAEDRLGGYGAVETDAYAAKIKVAYAGTAANSNAQSITIIADLGQNREYRETLWITDKEGKNYFLNKQDNTKKVALPGFRTIEDICLVTTEKPLSQQPTEEKMVNIYDYDQKKDVPKGVQVLTELTGKEVILGVTRQIVNKNEKQGDGTYKPVAESRTENVIDKVFHSPTKLTVVEAQQGATEPVFYDKWVEKNKGNDRDRRTIKDGEGGKSGRPGGAPQAGQQQRTSSLFNK